MNAKERIMRVLRHQKPDRMPCFGANSTVTYDQMEKVQAFWPEAHENGEAMARQALAAYSVLGFDAVRIPFSQTFEAEALGCKIKPGGSEGIPGIDSPPPYSIDDTPVFPYDFLSRGRIPELLRAVRILKNETDDAVPIVGGIIGPFTIAGALLETVPLLKASFKTPEKIRPFLEVGEKAGTALGRALIDEGADIIACEDMTASPALIAPDTYRDFELAYQKRQFDAISVPKILHICGNVDQIVEWMGKTGADIVSIEPKANCKLAREKCGPDIILMGGVDTVTTLLLKDTDTVKQECQKTIADGIQILAPGCAIAPGTPTENLLAMIEVAKAH
ncbi:MAG: MtaA/CmuA family methyltransferase [Deltaproteobacteria bacterium]|nr:MAG: MtaA/CmuA family methyltransferase [Deltaproteobacteria bacterium]